MRVETVVQGLALAGDLDLFCTVSERPDLRNGALAAQAFVRQHVHHRPAFGPSVRGMWRWLRTGWPRGAAWREWAEAATELAAFADPPYDLVWYSPASTWLGLHTALGRTTIVDFNDLEDEKLESVRRLRRGQRTPLTRRLRRALGATLDAADVGRWRRIQHRAADAADASVVCSDLDKERLGSPRTLVVPNSYHLTDPPRDYGPPATPTFTMVGLLSYPPNEDAAVQFARTILPLVRRRLPTARFLLVGRNDAATDALAEEPGVELLGYVPDLAEVFSATTAIVVPLRAGGGTRIKILEAFARRLPVVSTPIGCEGIDGRDGEELLIAESTNEFAAACVRVYEDEGLADSLAAKGQALWRARYRSEDVRVEIRDLAQKVANGDHSTPSSGSAGQ